ncbi:MAG: hypothetical protein ACJ72Z_08940 [Pyrinomonadaceae bacterium]
MTETDVKLIGKCETCGVEVRGGSLFCYNCGGNVGNENEILESSTSFSHSGPGQPSTSNSSQNGSSTERGQQTRTKKRPLRRRSSEPIQISWRPDENAGYGFLIFSVIAAFIVLVLIGIAFYLR